MEFQKITMADALDRSAGKYPYHIALNYMGKKITYQKLNSLVNQLARALLDLGAQPGDKISVCLPNLPQTVMANYAILRMGGVVVQNNPLYTERELAYQLKDSDSKMIITLSLLIPRVQKILEETSIEKIIGCHIQSYLPFPKKLLFPLVKRKMCARVQESDTVFDFEKLIQKYKGDSFENCGKWDELATLLYTGGTTGVSKGVMLSHANLSINVQQLAACLSDLKDAEERIVGTFPFFHIGGYTAIQNLSIWKAWEDILMPRPEPKAIKEIIKKYRPTFLPGVPTIFVGLLQDPEFRQMDLRSIKGFFSGAAPLADDTLRDLQELTGALICEVYGMTETSSLATLTPWGGKVVPGKVGTPMANTEVKILDLETGEKELLAGEAGEVAIKGPQVMMGYYKKPEETANALKDGWLYTGDIGFLDEEGYLQIVDRKKDMIIAGGYNIYPVEIDNILLDHPDIVEACSVGVSDSYRGETVKAFVVKKEGSSLSQEEVIQYCREKLAAYKAPKVVEFIDELPKSAVGKILRRELRDWEEKRGKN